MIKLVFEPARRAPTIGERTGERVKARLDRHYVDCSPVTGIGKPLHRCRRPVVAVVLRIDRLNKTVQLFGCETGERIQNWFLDIACFWVSAQLVSKAPDRAVVVVSLVGFRRCISRGTHETLDKKLF